MLFSEEDSLACRMSQAKVRYWQMLLWGSFLGM